MKLFNQNQLRPLSTAVRRTLKYCNTLLVIAMLALGYSSYALADADKVNETTEFSQSVELIDINQASAASLAKALKGIGRVKAKAIVNYRLENGDFTALDDLSKVKGISQRLIDQNRHLLKAF